MADTLGCALAGSPWTRPGPYVLVCVRLTPTTARRLARMVVAAGRRDGQPSDLDRVVEALILRAEDVGAHEILTDDSPDLSRT